MWVSMYELIMLSFSISILFLDGYLLAPSVMDTSLKAAAALPLGVSMLFLFSYLLSALGISLEYLPVFMIGIGVLLYYLFYLKPPKFLNKSLNKRKDSKILIFLGVGIFFLLLPRILYYQLPCDSVDSVFHAEKIKRIVEYGSLHDAHVFPSYPAGFHVLGYWIILLSGIKIPYALYYIRIFSWLLLGMSTYLFASTWFNKRVGVISVYLISLTNAYYYYHLNYVLPNFLAFSLFLVALSFFKEYIDENKMCIQAVLLGVATLFCHPFMFLSYFFITLMYFLITFIKSPSKKESFMRYSCLFLIIISLYLLLFPHSISLMKSGVSGAVYNGFQDRNNPNMLKYIVEYYYFSFGNYWMLFLSILALIYGLKHKERKQIIVLASYILFVHLLAINKIYHLLHIPYYSKIYHIERVMLLIPPILPVLYAVGTNFAVDIMAKNASKKIITYIFILFLFVGMILPYPSLLQEMKKNEYTYLIDNNKLELFSWIDGNFENTTFLNSCVLDSGLWIPYFTGDSILFTYITKCSINGITPRKFEKEILLGNSSDYNVSLAYVDTNYPTFLDGINPIELYSNFRLLKYEAGVWIFDLTERNASLNEDILKKALLLNRSYISGSMEEDGKYYVYGFSKRTPFIGKLEETKLYVAIALSNVSYIIFNPSADYNEVDITLISPETKNISITINNITRGIILTPGMNHISFKAEVVSDRINSIVISKEDRQPLFISNISLRKI